MPRAATAAARFDRHAAGRTTAPPTKRPATRPARRKSGPAARAEPARARVAAPSRERERRRRGPQISTRAAARTKAGSSQRPRTQLVLDRLLHGRAWITCIGALLVGIVFLNVTLMSLNEGITRTDARAAALKRENAGLRLQLAKLGSSERVQQAATARGFYMPAPGDVQYLRLNPSVDARRAARRITAPIAPPAPAATAVVSGRPAAGATPAAGPTSAAGTALAAGTTSESGTATPDAPSAGVPQQSPGATGAATGAGARSDSQAGGPIAAPAHGNTTSAARAAP